MADWEVSQLPQVTSLAAADRLPALDVDGVLPPSGGAGGDVTITIANLGRTLVAVGGMQRAYDVVIAPSNAPAQILAAADVVLTGTADQTLINAALAALPGEGRALIGPGNVSLTAPVVINQSNVELHGCGYATYIQAAASFSGAALVQLGTASVLTGNAVSDMQLDGHFGVASGTTVGLLASASQLLVERIEVKNSTGDSFYFQSWNGTTPIFEIGMRDCHAYSPAGKGVHVGTTCDNSEFQRVFPVGSNQGTPVAGSSDGFYVEGSDCKFLQCHPYFNAGNGMTLASGSANITVVDGEYETNTGYGIQSLGSDHLSVGAGTSFYANATGSLDLRTGTNLHASVTGCKFHDVGTVATTVISADGSTFGLSLTGNTFDCATGSALTSVISLASSGGAIVSNIFRTNNSAVNAILLNGATYNTISANFLDEKVTESGGADFNTLTHNRWNNVAATPVTLAGANSRATDNAPAFDLGSVVDAEQLACLSASYTLTNSTSAQKLFNATANGALTVLGSTTYEFECLLDITGLSGSAHVISFGFGGTATFTSAMYLASTSTSSGGAASLFAATAATATAVTASNTGTVLLAVIRGTLRVNAAGTIIPQVTQGTASAAAVVAAGSQFRAWPVGSNTVASVGNWS